MSNEIKGSTSRVAGLLWDAEAAFFLGEDARDALAALDAALADAPEKVRAAHAEPRAALGALLDAYGGAGGGRGAGSGAGGTAPADHPAGRAYRDRFGVAGVERVRASTGTRLFKIPAETFPGHVNNVYLMCDGDVTALWDAGSGMAKAREQIHRGIRLAGTVYGEPVTARDLTHVILSHGHIDHFGDVGYWRREYGAKLVVHELDARVLTNFEERVVVASKDLGVFLARAGVEEARVARFEEMYLFSKSLFQSVEVDVRLRDGELVAGRWPAVHTPGHCPGHICLYVGDVLLTGDQVLLRVTPHQSPQSITPFCGLENYVRSLAKLRARAGVRIGLPGHYELIDDVYRRIDETLAHHRERLEKVKSICAARPHTVAEVAGELFHHLTGYSELLGLEEAGAHVEYLSHLGLLKIANLEDVTKARDPVLRYRTV
ncbi:MAG TPA: MBL fold metallo-hydrolase [Myxococcota bacterium]|jgi:glyoxylase-like metal-dependent hydrolase (beta-lactamase superfamily II)|nr:MBL fold metallo-hydrolase [Myxococcota bacterium]